MKKNIITTIDESILEESKHILQQYDDTEFVDNCYSATGKDVLDDFIEKRIKNGVYKECTFNGNKFQYTGAAGIIFHDCKLIDCCINGTNMQFADFSNSPLIFTLKNNEKKIIQGCNLNQSCFYKSDWINAYIENSSISQAYFLSSEIKNCIFRHATLQENTFRNCQINNSSFIGCNMEYTEFDNVHIQDSVLPFHQISYIFGGLTCLSNKENTIKISSSMKNAPVLLSDEYLSLLPAFYDYYKNLKEYFPMININFYSNDIEKAKENIDLALIDYIKERQFRKLKAICKLTVHNDVLTRHDLSELYFKIIEYYRRISLNSNEEYQFKLQIDEIKNILCDGDFNKSSAMAAIKTNLTYFDYEKTGELIYIFEECLHFCNIKEDSYILEIRHNSAPLSFWITVNSIDPNLIVMFLGTLSAIATGDISSVKLALDVCASTVTILSFINQIRQSQISDYKNTETEEAYRPEADFVKKSHARLKEKKINLSFSLGNFHLNYENTKKYQMKC